MNIKLPDDPIVVLTFSLALGGNVTWAILFFTNSVKRKYAAERDFGHLKNNLKDLTDNLALLFKELDRRLDAQDKDLLELKAYLIGRGLIRRKDNDEDDS
ncbi:MAG: hypothetical protein RM368_37245 [Nostoc sp. DedSLP03]|uniref:hypothetical protein n=1 Tax=Nostoc sp. DedSLP03 TaxID=3075400 RepID=UPI002AD4B792|nr:hypothetical protein [Nostoc sp. DedSLP03]MDZ7970513.1 hypothetical protein [Nostoc sp. DedSLP03]